MTTLDQVKNTEAGGSVRDVADDLLEAEYVEEVRNQEGKMRKVGLAYESGRGVTLAFVRGQIWREYFIRRPGWRELPDPEALFGS